MQERVDNLITLLIDNIIRLETELLQVQEKMMKYINYLKSF